MKIVGLEDKIMVTDDRPVIDIETIDGKRVETVITVKKALIQCLSGVKGSVVDGLQIHEIMLKLHRSGNDIDMTESEMNRVKKAIEENPHGFFAFIIAQIHMKFFPITSS